MFTGVGVSFQLGDDVFGVRIRQDHDIIASAVLDDDADGGEEMDAAA